MILIEEKDTDLGRAEDAIDKALATFNSLHVAIYGCADALESAIKGAGRSSGHLRVVLNHALARVRNVGGQLEREVLSPLDQQRLDLGALEEAAKDRLEAGGRSSVKLASDLRDVLDGLADELKEIAGRVEGEALGTSKNSSMLTAVRRIREVARSAMGAPLSALRKVQATGEALAKPN